MKYFSLVKKYCLLLTALIWGAIIASALPSNLYFQKIGLPQGLPHVTINDIACDDDGFLWVATPDGVSRYDSYSFKNYDPAESKRAHKHGVSHVLSVDGVIYVSVDDALCRYNAETDAFQLFELPEAGHAIRTFVTPGDGTLILGTAKGLYLFDTKTNKFEKIIPQLKQAVNDMAMLDGHLYVGVGKQGMAKISKGGAVEYLPLPEHTDVNAVIADGSELLIATEGHGVFVYKPKEKRLEPFALLPSNIHVRALAFDDNKNLWAGTFNGLYVIEPNRSKVREIPVGDDGISHPSVRTICTDTQGGIWFGTYFGGLNYFNPLNNQVRTIRKNGSSGLNDNIVAVMAEDARHRVWIGTNNGGVNLYDPATGTMRYFTAADGLGSNDVKAIYIDESRGKAYVGTHIGAMSIIDLGSGSVRSANIHSRNVFAIEPTLDGRLWLNGFSGLFLYDPATGQCSREMNIIAGNRHLQRSTGLYRDSRKRLWVYGEDGVATFSENGGRLSPVKVLPDDVARVITDVKDVFEDSQHRIWLATNNGLRAFDGAGRELLHLNEKNGMPGHIVNAIHEDHSGKLWAGTNGGLVCVDAAKGTIDRMSLYDDYNNSRISVRSIITTSSGKMMVGGIDGLRIFNPSILEPNPYAPRPRITGLRLFDKPVRPGDETGLLQKSIEATSELTFNSDQTSFTIEFTVCNFPGGGDNTFYYMLEGIDRQWIQLADGQQSVTYSNLPSGKYRFMLKAANSDGVMSKDIATMDITILPVWYLSWWAITLWVILALGITVYIVRTVWHRKMLSAKMRMQQIDHERRQQTEEMKVRFFINLSHELRTPLTLMMLPVDELLARKNDSIVTEKLSIVKNNTLRILHIVNQMLDYRRAEMGMFKLQVHKVNINTLARDIYSSYE